MTATTGTARRALGRTRIAPKALARVVAAVAAGEFGLEASGIQVSFADDRGLLAVTIGLRIPADSLRTTWSDPASVDRAGGPLLRRAASAHGVIRERVGALTGARVGRLTVRITGADVRTGRSLR